MKFLLWGVIVFLLVMWFSRGRKSPAASEPAPAPRPSGEATEPMLQCAHCGVHFPSSEAVSSGGVAFCGKEHYLLGARGR